IPLSLISTLFPYTTLFRSLFKLVSGNFGADTSPRQTANAGALADIAVRLFQRLANVLLLDLGHDVPEESRQRPLEIDRERELGRSEEHTSELQSRGHLVCR